MITVTMHDSEIERMSHQWYVLQSFLATALTYLCKNEESSVRNVSLLCANLGIQYSQTSFSGSRDN